MSEVKAELKQCSRCHSNCTLKHFEKNRQGEWFKTCNNCRKIKQMYYENNKEEILTNVKQWRDSNKDKVKQYNKTSMDRRNPLIECPHCKAMIRYQSMENHKTGYVCNVFDLEPKPDYHEWLYQNQTDFYDQEYITRIQQSQFNIISWRNKKYGTSSACDDKRLKEALKDNNKNIDYIWNWNEGPEYKTLIN